MNASPIKQAFRWKLRKSGKNLLNLCTIVSFYSAASLCLLTPQLAMANPTGGAVVGGSATISSSGSELTVNQTTSKAIINWDSFNIDAGETTRFVQPSTSAIALNRVTNSQQVSVINGNLIANGRVILVNPNGILIGGTGNINTAGFIASTADIANGNFMNNDILTFSKAGNFDAVIENQGTITIADEGLGALVAPVVRNSGIIEGHMAKVQLAAADTFAVDFYGDGLFNIALKSNGNTPRDLEVANSGSIIADGGKVLMTAADASDIVSSAINMSGTIRAGSLVEHNGEIILTAAGADVHVSGDLDVSAVEDGADGGTILLGGGYKGEGDVAHSSTTTVTNTARVNADAMDNGDGGTIVVWSNDTTTADGRFSARGGDLSGDGGLVETSSEGGLYMSDIIVDARAPAGENGDWLIDPLNITVVESGATGDDINASVINTALADVILQADNNITFQADINIIEEGISLTAIAGVAGSDIMGLEAGQGDIQITNQFVRTNGGDVTWISGNDIQVNKSVFYLRGGSLTMISGTIGINNNAAISTAGGDVTLTAIAAGEGSSATSGNITTNSVYIETTSPFSPGIGGISVTDENGVQDYINDYGNPQNEFYETDNGGAITITGDGTVGGNSVCFAAGSMGNCVVPDPIPPTAITITADDIMKIYGDADPLLTYTFTGTLADGDSFTGSLVRNAGEDVNTYTILQGTLDITGGNGSYEITYVPGTFTITPAELTITADPQTKVYGDMDPALTYTASGFKFMDNESLITGDLTRDAGENVGFYDILDNGLDAGANYTINYVGNQLEITPALLTVTANNDSKTYDAVAYSGGNGVMYSGFVLGDDAGDLGGMLTYGGTSQGAVNVGNYIIEASGLTSTNYTINYVDGTLTIDPASLTVTANDAMKTYGDTLVFNGTEFMTSGLLGMDSVDSVTLTSAGAVNTANVGSYDIEASSALGSGLGNYTINYVDGTLTIDPASLTVTANDVNKIYDGLAYSGGSVTYSGFANGEDAGDLGGMVVYGGSSQGAVNVGNYVIDIQGSNLTSGNYDITYVDGALTVDPALLVITANDDSKLVDGIPYSGGNGVTYSGFVNGEDESVLMGMIVYGGSSQGATNVGSYVIDIQDSTYLSADEPQLYAYDMEYGPVNYTIDYVNGTLTITTTETPLLKIDPLDRPIVSVANQSLVLDEQFEPTETLELSTNVSISGAAAPATTALPAIEPAAGGEEDAEGLAAIEPAAGGGTEDGVSCANAFLDNNPCAIDIAQ